MSLRRLLFSLLVAVAVAAMVSAGFWQLHRLSERRDRNDAIADRSRMPVVELQELVGVNDPYGVGSDFEFRRVRAEGVYLPGAEVLIRNRSYEGSAGYWVLTPLRLGSGALVAVNRGWVPFGAGGSPAGFAPVSAEVAVVGFARATVTAAGLQQADPADGVLAEMARPDLARLSQQLDGDLLPVYIQLRSESPSAGGALPVPVPLPDPGDGAHLAYAVQWFVFAAVAALGYLLVLRRTSSLKP